MKHNNEGTFITGLWENEKNGKKIFIGRISMNLNAVIVKNKNKRGDKDPTHLLYFFNGNAEEIKNFVGEKYGQQN